MALVYIALGSNLMQPSKQVTSAIYSISTLPNTDIISLSPFYRSIPLGSADQPDYLNAVIKINTLLLPELLLDQLQLIELKQGRERKKDRFSPRTLDLDILLYDNLIINSPRLTIPHDGLKNREFMLYPLFDLEPNLLFPDGDSLVDRLKTVPINGMLYWND